MSAPFPRYGEARPASAPPAFRVDGVLTRRFFAYLIDLVMIGLLSLLLGLVVAVLGLFTFGAAWILYAVLLPATFVLYSALTVGGPAQGTVGMRMLDLAAVDAGTGAPVGPLLAGAHALLFYLGVGTFLLLLVDIAIGLARSDRRLGHDLLAGVAIVRR